MEGDWLAIEQDLGYLMAGNTDTSAPLCVTISGLDDVKPEQESDDGIWFASASGRHGGYAYRWERDGQEGGGNNAYYSDDTGTDDFLCEVVGWELPRRSSPEVPTGVLRRFSPRARASRSAAGSSATR